MKKILVAVLSSLLLSTFALAATGEKDVTLEVKKINGKSTWVPEKIVVHQGEKLKITAKYEGKGGYDYHGLLIPALHIQEKVERNKPKTIETTIPADMKPGEYKVECQFHSAHIPATLVVEPAKK